MKKHLFFFMTLFWTVWSFGQNVTTFAGSGTAGSTDATGTAASFNLPYGVAVDALGNVFVADGSNNKIRKITPTGAVSTFAGSGIAGSTDGTGTAASFNDPGHISIDISGNIYVADYGNHKIRKITAAGVVSTLAGSGIEGSADGTGAAASFSLPLGVAVDALGNVFVADNGNHKIRKITPTGVVSTFAGSGIQGSTDGAGTAAHFNAPFDIIVDGSGNVYVADLNNHKIRKITPAGLVSTFAGSGIIGSADGIGTAASFNYPYGIAVDGSGNVYVADTVNHKIRKITAAGVVTTFAGSGSIGNTDGIGTAASFNGPVGVTVDATGNNVYVADVSNHKIRKIAPPPATHLNFDGANDNVTIPSDVSGAIAQGSEITIEYWFKGTNLQSAVRIQNGINYIVAGWGGSNPQFIVSTDGGTNGVLNGTESVIEDNTWHHIACVWKKNVTFATYLDGVLQNSRVAANVNLPNVAGTEGKLGSLNGGSEFMTGNLDDVRIWNVARTAAQISANRNCELQANESGLVAYYKFNQGVDIADNSAITTLTDATAAANNGTLVNFTKTGSTSNFLAGSPVTTGITVPTAPTVSDQTFCGATTANSLVPAISATIKWYASATALVTTDNLTTGTYYVVAVNANGCESERTAVSVVILENPETDDTQFFCNSATVNDLQPAPSETITWFADAEATTALLATSALVDGTTYYVQATGGSCPPSPIVASTVAITSATAPTNIGGEVTDDANKNLNVIYTGADCSHLNGLYVVNGTLNGKNVYSQLGGMRTIGYDNIDNKWKLYYGNNISLSLRASNNSTANYPPASGWILEECAGTLTTETASTYNQIVCNNSNATHLMPPPSDTIKWFESATGTYNFDSNYPLSDDVYYVAGVNENGCESPRTAVTVSFLPQPAAPIVVGTPTATSGITVSVTGGCSNFSGNYYYLYTDPNGKNVYSSETESSLMGIYYDIEENRWSLGTYVNNGVYSTDFIYPTTSTSAFPPTTGWTVENNTCAGATLNIGFTQIEQNYCQGATAANIAGTDPSLKIYNSNGQNIALTDELTSGIYAVVTVGANGCESDGNVIQINIETVAPPVPAGATISFASSQENMIILCPGTVTVALLNGTFNYTGQDVNGRNQYVFADDAQVELKYLGFPYNWVIIKQTNVLFKSDDSSTANVPPTSGWTSTCGVVAVTVTVNDFAQSFCGNAQVNDLLATGTGTIKWYNVDTAGIALNSNDAIATGDYYVSQTNNNGCESAKVKVAVTVTSAPVATVQSFCGSATVADLVATGQNLKWYLEPDDLTILASTEALTTRTYYVSQTVGDCTPTRTAVVVTVTPIPSTPTGNVTQTLPETNATIAGILVTPATAVWFASESDATAGTNALSSTTALTTGTTYYAVTISNGCSSLPLAVTITVTLANESFDIANFKYYPNPTTGILNIDFSQDIQQVNITNLLGQLVQETTPNTRNAKIDMSSLPTGNYLLQVKTNEQTKTIKVIKN